MTDLPVTFSASMVLALLREVAAPGTGKTMTRRLLRHRSLRAGAQSAFRNLRIGDRLWVRETYCLHGDGADPAPLYKASHRDPARTLLWKSGRFMARRYSRLTLVMTEDARVEPLQDITDADALAEGVLSTTLGEVRPMLERTWDAPDDLPLYAAPDDDEDDCLCTAPREAFRRLWNLVHFKSVHGPEIDTPAEWEANPDVVALRFRPILCNIDDLPPQP